MSRKVLFLLHYPPPVHGSSMVGEYIRNSKTINNSFKTKYINIGTSRSVDEIGKNPVQKLSRYLQVVWKTFKHVFSEKPDLFYIAITAKGIAFYKDAVLVLIAKLRKLPIVYHMHNKGVSVRQNNVIDNILYKWVFSNSKVILLSTHLYFDISKYVDEKNVFYCPYGIPDIDITITRHIKTTAPVQLLFLSNLIESKGVIVLLESCSILLKKGKAFQCTFVGGEGDIDRVLFEQKVLDLGLSNHVQYLGKKYGSDKHKVFLEADIFVFPTYYHNETFGLVNLEAMQYALPVISTNEGGIPDIIDDEKTGFIVKQKDALHLAEKLEKLIDSPSLRLKMGQLGQNKYKSKFRLGTFEDKVQTILEDILSSTNKDKIAG